MSDKGKDYNNLQPLGLSHLEYLEYLKVKALHNVPEFPKKNQLDSLSLLSMEIEKAIDETIAFLMCNIVVPHVFKQFLFILKDLNETLRIVEVELGKCGYTENIRDLERLNREIDRELNIGSENYNFLPNAIDIKFEILNYIKVETVEKPSFPAYCEIGSLFAQGFVTKKNNKATGSYIYLFKEKEFDDFPTLLKYIKSILTKDARIRQYVSDTLNNTGIKDIYSSKKMMQEILRYCKYNRIQPTANFIEKMELL